MTNEEIREQVLASETPIVARFENYEDSAQFVGTVFGEKSEAPAAGAQALAKALGLDECAGDCCGCCCDSNCDCS